MYFELGFCIFGPFFFHFLNEILVEQTPQGRLHAWGFDEFCQAGT